MTQPPESPTRPSVTRRTARAALRRVDAVFSAKGPAFKQLALSWAANVAGDTLVALALAGTLFFSVPSSEARGNVALYLLITLAPFAVVAPLLGGVFARFPMYRGALTISAALRAVIAVIMTLGLDTIWLYPLAFTMLVLSRLYGISKSSLLPVALPQPVALVSANSLLARIGIFAGGIVLPFGAVTNQIGSALTLLLSVAFFGFSAFVGIGLPEPGRMVVRDAGVSGPARRPGERRGPPHSIRLARLATAGVRLINGYLLILLAFAFHEPGGGGILDFGALIGAAGLGYGLASFISPWLERHLQEEPMVVAALALEAAAAFIAGQMYEFAALAGAAGLALAAGLAWGTAKFAFDGLLQRTVRPDRRGSAFTRAETLFQLGWVIGALIALIDVEPEVGLAVAGVAALTAQTLFVAGLLVPSEPPPS